MAKKKFNIDLTEKTSQSVDEDVFLINDSAENDITKKTKYIKGRNIGKIDRKTGVTDAQKQSLLKINSDGNIDYTNICYASSLEELKTLLLDAAHKHIIVTNTIQIQMGGDIEVKCGALISCGSKLQVANDLNFLNTSPYLKTLIFDCRLEASFSKTITASNNDLTFYIKELKGDFQWTGEAGYDFNIKVSTLVSGTNTTTNSTFTTNDNTYWNPTLPTDSNGVTTIKAALFEGVSDLGNLGATKTISTLTAKHHKGVLTEDCVITLPTYANDKTIAFTLKLTQGAGGGFNATFQDSDTNPAVNLSEFDFTSGAEGNRVWITFLWDSEEWAFTTSNWID